MADLNRATVFLSASFPSGKRSKKFKPYDPSGIADAVAALTRSVLMRNGQLLFGGHPTITPLVLMIARELNVRKSVVVYQSGWFWDSQLPEVQEIYGDNLGRVVWTDPKDSLEQSLETMREAMLNSARNCAAAIFVGGMEGIQDEYSMAKRILPNTPRIPIVGPGGAAALLPQDSCNALGLAKLCTSRAYPLLSLQLVDAIAQRVVSSGN